MSDTPRTDAEDPDLINLMEWNRFAEQGMTLLEVLTILNNRHRAEIKAMMVAETHAMRELNAAKAALCDWKEDEDGIWDTSCEQGMVFEYVPPNEQGYNFCHHCGKPIQFTRFTFIEKDEEP